MLRIQDEIKPIDWSSVSHLIRIGWIYILELTPTFLGLIWIKLESYTGRKPAGNRNKTHHINFCWFGVFILIFYRKSHYSLPFLKFLSFFSFIVSLRFSCLCFFICIPISSGGPVKNFCGWILRLISIKSWPISFAYALKDFCADDFLRLIGSSKKCWRKKDYSNDYCSNERKKLNRYYFEKLYLIDDKLNSEFLNIHLKLLSSALCKAYYSPINSLATFYSETYP